MPLDKSLQSISKHESIPEKQLAKSRQPTGEDCVYEHGSGRRFRAANEVQTSESRCPNDKIDDWGQVHCGKATVFISIAMAYVEAKLAGPMNRLPQHLKHTRVPREHVDGDCIVEG